MCIFLFLFFYVCSFYLNNFKSLAWDSTFFLSFCTSSSWFCFSIGISFGILSDKFYAFLVDCFILSTDCFREEGSSFYFLIFLETLEENVFSRLGLGTWTWLYFKFLLVLRVDCTLVRREGGCTSVLTSFPILLLALIWWILCSGGAWMIN